MKRCFTSYTAREMQSKITMRYHYKSIRVALAKKGFGQHQCQPGRGATGTLIHCWWEHKMLCWKVIWWLLTKLNMFLQKPRCLPWYLPKGVKNFLYFQTESCTWMFIIALFIISPNWKPQKCPSIFDWINKLWYTHTVEN